MTSRTVQIVAKPFSATRTAARTFAIFVATAPLSVVSLAQSNTGDPMAGRVTPVVSNHVLVIGTLTPKAAHDAVRSVLQLEVEDTVRLYLDGRLDQWFFTPDDSGVVFIFNSLDIKEVDTLLATLPLSRTGLMNFRTTRLAPLRPLGLLLPSLTR